MRLATIMRGNTSHAAFCTDSRVWPLLAPDVGALLQSHSTPQLQALHARSTAGVGLPWHEVTLRTLIPEPGKVICVGMNYADHIAEMGRDAPKYPTLFSKFTDALIDPDADIVLPPESTQVDWEAELVVVIGKTVRRATAVQAEQAIAGFTIMNDISMRDYQYRSPTWLQGKTWANSTPVGPVLVTPDALPGGVRPELEISCRINGIVKQQSNTRQLVFDAVDLVTYISTIVTLRPGDLIATGTPGGVGHARTPAEYLRPGDEVETWIESIGTLRNRVVAER